MQRLAIVPALLLLAAVAGRTASDSALAAKLEGIRTQHNVPALAAAILANGEVRDIAVAGTIAADAPDAVTADDAWHIGSCTKAMTATLAARLIEQGKLAWDTTLAEGLPELAADMSDAQKAITLRQLLGHRSGIIGQEGNGYAMPVLWSVQQEMADRPMDQRRRVAARRILKAPYDASAAGKFNYSNYGYILAGAMLERAGGAAWEELMKREVFEPLGMSSAGFGPPPRVRGHVRKGESWSPLVHDNPAILGPAGTVHCSLRDWSKFAAAHLGHVEGYLTPETLAILHEPLPGEGASYALGWGTRRDGEGKVAQLSHAGSNTMWYAVVVLDLQKQEARFAATNCASQAAADAAIQALEADRDPD